MIGQGDKRSFLMTDRTELLRRYVQAAQAYERYMKKAMGAKQQMDKFPLAIAVVKLEDKVALLEDWRDNQVEPHLRDIEGRLDKHGVEELGSEEA